MAAVAQKPAGAVQQKHAQLSEPEQHAAAAVVGRRRNARHRNRLSVAGRRQWRMSRTPQQC